MAKWKQVGSLRKGKTGNLYIKTTEDIPKDANLQLKKPEDDLKGLLERGFIDEAEYEKRLDAVPDYIRYQVLLPPQD